VCSNPECRGTATPPPVKDRDTLIEQSVTRISKAHRIMVKQVVYDKFMKQIRTVKHSFSTTGMANYRVQLAVPLSIKNNFNIIIILFSKKLTNKYTKN